MMDGAAEVAYRTHRLSVFDFLRMDEIGLFDPEARVELLDGEIIDMAPIGSPHAATVAFLNHRLMGCLGERAILWVQNPVVLDEASAPQPDLAVVRPRQDYYRRQHPRPDDILLLIEVADTSLALDRDKKMPLYARAEIPELWIVDIVRSTFHVFREPRLDHYSYEQTLIAPASLGIAAFSDVAVVLSGLFPE